jgi:hypothetical protein
MLNRRSSFLKPARPCWVPRVCGGSVRHNSDYIDGPRKIAFGAKARDSDASAGAAWVSRGQAAAGTGRILLLRLSAAATGRSRNGRGGGIIGGCRKPNDGPPPGPPALRPRSAAGRRADSTARASRASCVAGRKNPQLCFERFVFGATPRSGAGAREPDGRSCGSPRRCRTLPDALRVRTERRASLAQPGGSSVHEHELVAVQDDAAGVRESVLLGVLRQGLRLVRGRRAIQGQLVQPVCPL